MAGLVLEELGGPRREARHDPSPPAQIEEQGPAAADVGAAYEDGYQAGWEDAIKSHQESLDKVNEEFSRNIRELTFTFHEARSHVLRSMEPLLSELVQTVFPSVMSETMAMYVTDVINPILEECADTPIELIVSPDGFAMLKDAPALQGNTAIRIREESTLSPGQAYFRIGKVERQLDLTAAMAQLQTAVTALFDVNERTIKHV